MSSTDKIRAIIKNAKTLMMSGKKALRNVGMS